MPAISIKNINKTYIDQDGNEVQALHDINLDVAEGEFVCIVGPSGCGKSTLLEIVAGLLDATSGEVLLDGQPVHGTSRDIGVVFQDASLFPWRTVRKNVAFGLEIAGVPREEREERLKRYISMVSLNGFENKYPAQLSGGMRQRAGIARTLAMNPKVILMDEPFSALDPMTRAELQDEVHRLQLRFHKTIVFVTHDMDEAVKLADRICILQNGHVVQCDKPENILKHPANEYINSFIGKNRLWENPSFIRAEDIMRPRPITISQSRTVVQAVQLMRHYNIDSLLVTGDDNKFAGMVWLQDLIGIDQYSSPVSSFLSDDYLSVRVDDSLSTVLEKVADYGEKDFGILPVLDAEGAIRGFLNRSSLLSTLSRRFIDEPVERDEQEGA